MCWGWSWATAEYASWTWMGCFCSNFTSNMFARSAFQEILLERIYIGWWMLKMTVWHLNGSWCILDHECQLSVMEKRILFFKRGVSAFDIFLLNRCMIIDQCDLFSLLKNVIDRIIASGIMMHRFRWDRWTLTRVRLWFLQPSSLAWTWRR